MAKHDPETLHRLWKYAFVRYMRAKTLTASERWYAAAERCLRLERMQVARIAIGRVS